MLLQFMARTGASRSARENTVSPAPRVIHKDRLPGAHRLKIFSPRKVENQISNTELAVGHPCGAPRNQETRGNGEPQPEPPGEAINPTAGLGSRNPDADQKRMESNSLTLNLLKSQPFPGRSVYKSPEPDVIHKPQH